MRPTRSVIWFSTLCTSGITLMPLTDNLSPTGRRRAVCKAGRPSEALTISPLNNALIASCRPTSFARPTSRLRVSAVIRFFE
ncbi:hypothetical protein D3C84_1058470 [compost metagenome]